MWSVVLAIVRILLLLAHEQRRVWERAKQSRRWAEFRRRMRDRFDTADRSERLRDDGFRRD